MSLLLTLVVSCNKPEPEPVVETLPFAISDTLLRIDSLMQHDADSALIMLMSFRPTEGSGEISYKFNDNYQSLLLAEALYKTYNPQLNRYKNETFQETSLRPLATMERGTKGVRSEMRPPELYLTQRTLGLLLVLLMLPTLPVEKSTAAA